MIMVRKRTRNYDDPLRHPDHPRPRTRRQFLSQGFIGGSALALGSSLVTLPWSRRAHALDPQLQALLANCGVGGGSGRKIPFICFDLAGGSNVAGSNVLIGQRGGQLDFLTTAGYERQGLPADMVPPIVNPVSGTNDFINTEFGLAFHSDSAFLRGMIARTTPATRANVNGAVIPARSENDTGNNPHNPMYGIARAIAQTSGSPGQVADLVGSDNSDSGGNSMAPASLIDLTKRPTKVDRPSDVVGLVDVGDLTAVLAAQDAVRVMESVYRISDQKMSAVNPYEPIQITQEDVVRDMVRCGYLKAADLADKFAGVPVDPLLDQNILSILPAGDLANGGADGREFRKTASVMKMVINGFANAGTIEMGGYDYHGGRRAEGEVKDFRAGQCMGACLEYAAILGTPLMMYVFSDGSLSSNGVIDNTADGRGKGEWTSDNQQTAAAFFLTYSPGGRAVLRGATPADQARHQQIGFMRPDGSVETAGTPMANNVNLLAYSAVLNYMALHGDEGEFGNTFGNIFGTANPAILDAYMAFEPIVPGFI
jgi:hypothetical protein